MTTAELIAQAERDGTVVVTAAQLRAVVQAERDRCVKLTIQFFRKQREIEAVRADLLWSLEITNDLG